MNASGSESRSEALARACERWRPATEKAAAHPGFGTGVELPDLSVDASVEMNLIRGRCMASVVISVPPPYPAARHNGIRRLVNAALAGREPITRLSAQRLEVHFNVSDTSQASVALAEALGCALARRLGLDPQISLVAYAKRVDTSNVDETLSKEFRPASP